MPYMVPNPDSEADGTVKHPMYDGPGGKDLEASHVFASERNKMYYRGLQQRQSQSPQRFFKAGTHGQDFEQRALHEYGHKQHAAAQPNRWSDEDRKRYRADLVAAGHVEGENETRFWDEVDEDIDARTRARQKAERQGETVSGTETPKFDLDALDD